MENNIDYRREMALERSKELKGKIQDYLQAREEIPSGLERKEAIREQQRKIMECLDATPQEWNDWQWQVKNRISHTSILSQVLELSPEQCQQIEKVGEQYRWTISPYYLSLIDPDNRIDPVKMQSVPSALELDTRGSLDPMAEEDTSPAPLITRRYPDRLIIKVTNQCGMYCRHCQRRRYIGEVDRPADRKDMEAAIEYIRQNPEIRDVLLTGGDAFLLGNDVIEWLLSSLRDIPHVEIIRLGTRTLVTMPQRVDEELVEILARYHPVYVNTQFNHPQEVTEEAAQACDRLTRAGVVIGNQMVLLRGINNEPFVVKKLNHELLKSRVIPYYIFHAKGVRGTTHFRTRVERGIEIMEQLRGYTSGLAIPTYIINAPKGQGKTPILPEYLVSWGRDHVLIRTWEKKVLEYPNYRGDWTEENIF